MGMGWSVPAVFQLNHDGQSVAQLPIALKAFFIKCESFPNEIASQPGSYGDSGLVSVNLSPEAGATGCYCRRGVSG